MSLLLDTHAFIWWADSPERLPARVRAACEDCAVPLYLSLVSVWEMQIKLGLGKLWIGQPLPNLVREQQDNGIALLGIGLPHLWEIGRLPAHHRDPFDRMLVAQARIEGLRLVSADERLDAYGIDRFW